MKTKRRPLHKLCALNFKDKSIDPVAITQFIQKICPANIEAQKEPNNHLFHTTLNFATNFFRFFYEAHLKHSRICSYVLPDSRSVKHKYR